MNITKMKQIDLAINEVNRFLERANLWKVRLSSDPMASISGSREGGDCKRASLDLSRALVQLRNKI